MSKEIDCFEEEAEEENESLFVESVLDTKKYKSKDDLEVLEVAKEMQQFHVTNKTERVPNWKNFPPSRMTRYHKRRHTTKTDSRKFHLFCSKIRPCKFYPIEELVQLYNSIFTDNPVSNVAFGRLSDVRANFTKHRKVVDGRKKTYYEKKINK